VSSDNGLINWIVFPLGRLISVYSQLDLDVILAASWQGHVSIYYSTTSEKAVKL